MEKITRVGVGLYIFNEHNQLLLGLRKSSHGFNTWCPPGGHMEFGETNEEAAIRETKEETNLTINANDVWLEGVTNDFFKETDKHYITLHFFCKKYQGEPKVMEPEKFTEWKWFDINNLPENLMLPNKNFLKKHRLL